jgi:hypothetical protein
MGSITCSATTGPSSTFKSNLFAFPNDLQLELSHGVCHYVLALAEQPSAYKLQKQNKNNNKTTNKPNIYL